MRQRPNNQKPSQKPEFLRKCVTIPAELGEFAVERSNKPDHAGNLSSYIRSLILRDRDQQAKPA